MEILKISLLSITFLAVPMSFITFDLINKTVIIDEKYLSVDEVYDNDTRINYDSIVIKQKAYNIQVSLLNFDVSDFL